MLLESQDSTAPDHTIQPYGVVHVRAKLAKHADGKVCGLLEEIVASRTQNNELQQLADDFKIPIFIHDSKFGRLEYNRSLKYFSGLKKHKRLKIQLLFTAKRPDQYDDELAKFNKIWDSLGELTDQACMQACDELLDIKNETWIEEGDRPVSNKKFMKRMKLSEVSMNQDYSFELWFDDDDMFWGHAIEVRFNPDHSISEVCISG